MAIITNKITADEIKTNLEKGINDEPIKEEPKIEEPKQDENADEPNPDEANNEPEVPENANPENEEPDKTVTPPDPQPPVTPKEEPPVENDLEKRYKESSREAIVQLNRSRSLIKTISEAITQDVTDEEVDATLQDKFQTDEWEEMTTSEQGMWKETIRTQLQMRKQQEKIKGVVAEIEDEDAYQARVKEFITKSQSENKHTVINGREEDFTRYCMQTNHKGTDPEILANAFAFEAPPIKKKQNVLNGNSGGGIITKKENPQNQPMSVDDIKFLMKNNNRKYMELVKNGTIKAEDLLKN